MKKNLSYFLLLSFLIIFVSACSDNGDNHIDDTDDPEYLTNQLRADAGSNKVTLEWKELPAADTYNIYYIADPDETYSSAKPPSSEVMKAGTKITGLISAPLTISGLTNGTKYWFALSAKTEGQDESDLTIATHETPKDDPPLPAPENVRANAGDGEVTVTWDSVTGADGYKAYAYTSFENIITSDKTTSTSNSYTFTGLKNGQKYMFFVQAMDSDDNTTTGDSSASFLYSAEPSTKPPPSAPVITAVTAGNSQITIAWNAVTAYPAVTSYRIYIANAMGVTKLTGQLTSITELTEPLGAIATTNIDNGTTYYIVVTAVNANGESAESSEWWATPSATTPHSGNNSGQLIIFAH